MTLSLGNQAATFKAHQRGTAPRRARAWLAVVAVSLLALAGCGSEGRPAYDDAGGVDSGSTGGSSSGGGACEAGTSQACGFTVDQANGVLSCYRGTQYCDDGVWSECTDGEITKEPDPNTPQAQDYRRALSLSQPAKCTDQPCDPSCMWYVEDPSPDISGGGPPPGTLPSYPGKPPTCSHALCTTGGPLAASCNSCVGQVCAADSTCCTTAWTSSCVNLVYTQCALQRPPLELCDFGLYSDSTVVLANKSSSDAVIGAYGDIQVSTDSVFKGIISTGNITFANLNGANVNAPYGIIANGSVSFSASNASIITANIEAGTQVDVVDVDINGVVRAGTNIVGQSGGKIFGNAFANGTISGNVIVSPGTAYPGAGFTPTPVSLPPQTAGSSIPKMPVICTGTTNFSQSGGTMTVNGPGTYGDVNISNNGTITLKGQGTYYFKSFQVSDKIVLDPNGAALAGGWDIRVCGTVNLNNGTKIIGGTGITNDSNSVMLDPKLLSFYADTTGTVSMGTDVYWTGILLAPNATISKGNMNSPPTSTDIANGVRSAPVNGALWGKSLNVGTNSLTKSIAKADCQAMSVASFFPAVVCPVIDDGTPPALDEPCVSGLDCQINHSCVEPKTQACTHSKCMVGAALTASCDECVARICAADATCCNVGWTQSCVDRVATNCDAICGTSECGGSVCTPGPAINATACGTCVSSVCAAMPSCCTTAWTSACVTKAYSVCGSTVPSYTVGNSVCDYAVYTTGSMNISGGTAATPVTISGGKVGGQGLGAMTVYYATLNDDLYGAGSLALYGTTVNGSVIQGGGSMSVSSSTITGSQKVNAVIPSAPRPTRTFTCPATNGAVSSGGSIAPGAYGAVSIPDGATLTLSAGTYTFTSLTLGTVGGTGANLAIPSSGHVTINVCGAVTFNKSSKVTGLTQSTALNLDLYATGNIKFVNGNVAYGFFNTDGSITVDNQSKLYGMAISQGTATVTTGAVVDSSGLGDQCRALGLDPTATTLSSPGRLCAYGVYAGSYYNGGTDITVTGDVGSSATGTGMNVGRGIYNGNVLSQGTIYISDVGTVVKGDIRSKTTIQDGGNKPSYSTMVAPDSTLLSPTFPSPAFICPTGGASQGIWSGTTALAPGSYGAVQVGATLSLSAGTYYMSSLDLYYGATIVLPATGNVTLYVCGAVGINGNVTETGIGTGVDALRFRIYSAATSGTAIRVEINDLTKPFRGILLAPSADINIGSSTKMFGNAWAKNVYIGNNAILDSTGVTGAACEAAGIDNLPPCPATLTPTTPSEGAKCVTNPLGYKDAKCATYDLAVDIPCGTTIPVCNHGSGAFSGNLQIGYWADAKNQMSNPAPVVSPTGICSATGVSIPAGTCLDVSCTLPAGLNTVMVDPNKLLTECNTHRLDNWSVHDGRTCGSGTSVEEQTYEAKNCPADTSARWGLLTWNTEITGTATITFSARTAKTEAGLGAASYKVLGTAKLSPDTQVCTFGGPSPTCPIDVTKALTLGTSQPPWLGLKMELNSSGGTTLLKDWHLTYSCVFDQ